MCFVLWMPVNHTNYVHFNINRSFWVFCSSTSIKFGFCCLYTITFRLNRCFQNVSVTVMLSSIKWFFQCPYINDFYQTHLTNALSLYLINFSSCSFFLNANSIARKVKPRFVFPEIIHTISVKTHDVNVFWLEGWRFLFVISISTKHNVIGAVLSVYLICVPINLNITSRKPNWILPYT